MERPLVESYLAKVDVALQPGLETLNWKSTAIDTFISEISSLSASHLVQFQRLYTTQRGPCALCGQLLAGRAYDASCSSRVIRDNMRSTTVRCYCMRQELPWEHVSLLTIGAHTH